MVAKGYERVMCKKWVGDWKKTATYWPQALLAIAALLSRSAGLLNRGPWGPSPLLKTGSHCLELQQLTPNSKLHELPVAPGYIIVWHPLASCKRHICTEFNLSTVKVIPTDLFGRMHLFLDRRLGQRAICYTCDIVLSEFGILWWY